MKTRDRLAVRLEALPGAQPESLAPEQAERTRGGAAVDHFLKLDGIDGEAAPLLRKGEWILDASRSPAS